MRNGDEYCAFREYIHRNPVKGRLASVAEEYAYSSARAEFQMDYLSGQSQSVLVLESQRWKRCATQKLVWKSGDRQDIAHFSATRWRPRLGTVPSIPGLVPRKREVLGGRAWADQPLLPCKFVENISSNADLA